MSIDISLELEQDRFSPKDFLYQRKGPWPQPAPEHPHGQAAAVLHLPWQESMDWNWNVGLRYVRQLIGFTPVALWRTLVDPHLHTVTDSKFTEILTDGVISSFLCPKLDPRDQRILKSLLDTHTLSEGESWYKVDFSPMAYVQTHPGLYAAVTVTLFKRKKDQSYEVIGTWLNNQVFTPKDGDAWELAKYYALQGAGICVTLLKHPAGHFPTDAVNAITQTSLPVKHPIFMLLRPHFRLALGVSDAVLHGKGTVLKSDTFYSPYPGTMKDHVELVATGWKGLKYTDGTYNSAYPPYEFSLDPPVVHSGYGEFLKRYWITIYDFVYKVTQTLDKKDPFIKAWARDVGRWLPGFPSVDKIVDPVILAKALTYMIHQVSIQHSSEHYDYATKSVNEVPMRLRVPPPNSKSVKATQNKLVKFVDTFKYHMCMQMFFKTFPITRMDEIDYGFEGQLKKDNQDFMLALKKTEEGLKKDGIKVYIPLCETAPSIQF